MSKNGGEGKDPLVTLEQALARFATRRAALEEKRRRYLEQTQGDSSRTKIHYANFSPSYRRDEQRFTRSDTRPLSQEKPTGPLLHDAAGADPDPNDFIATIGGVRKSFVELDRLQAAEDAYERDFPASPASDQHDSATQMLGPAERRRVWFTETAMSVMGASLALLVAFAVWKMPLIKNPGAMIARTAATPALKASQLRVNDDLITTLVVISDSDALRRASSSSLTLERAVRPVELEGKIRDTLKTRAFPDIGVSVSKKGDAFLAGDVYSLDEANKITRIVQRVDGVRRAHFLHPDVREAGGGAYFGVITAWAPEVWGAKVQAVFIGSPAYKAGLHPGDVISEFDGHTVPDGAHFDDLVAKYSPGQRVQFRVWHDGQPQYLVARMTDLASVAAVPTRPKS